MLLKQDLEVHLATSRKYAFQCWADTDVLVGEAWDQRIRSALHESHLGVLLISASFLQSTYIKTTELPCFVNGQVEGESGKRAVPVLLKAVAKGADLQGLEQLQIFAKGNEAYADLDQHRRNGWVVELVEQIEALLDRYADLVLNPDVAPVAAPTGRIAPARATTTAPSLEILAPEPPQERTATGGSCAAEAGATEHPAEVTCRPQQRRSLGGHNPKGRTAWALGVLALLVGLLYLGTTHTHKRSASPSSKRSASPSSAAKVAHDGTPSGVPRPDVQPEKQPPDGEDHAPDPASNEEASAPAPEATLEPNPRPQFKGEVQPVPQPTPPPHRPVEAQDTSSGSSPRQAIGPGAIPVPPADPIRGPRPAEADGISDGTTPNPARAASDVVNSPASEHTPDILPPAIHTPALLPSSRPHEPAVLSPHPSAGVHVPEVLPDRKHSPLDESLESPHQP